MRLIGCDLHASQQSIAMLDRHSGVIVEKTLKHEGEAVREFYASIPPPVIVGIEATGSMGWFLRLMEELAIECRVGHPVAIRKAEIWGAFLRVPTRRRLWRSQQKAHLNVSHRPELHG